MAGRVDMMREIEAICAFPMRGPTKEGERLAAEYLERRMNELGLETTVEPFKISPHYYWVYFVHVLLAIAAGAVSVITRPVWVPILCAVLLALVVVSFWGDLTTRFHLIRNIIPRYPSQNVVGRIPREGARRQIFVSAHYDAAKAGDLVFNPELDEKIARFYKERFDSTPNVMMPILACMVGLLVVALVRVFLPSGSGMWIGTWIVQGLSSIGLLVAAVSFFDIGIGHYVPGATDNLTGIASCLSIAESVLDEPLENSELTVLALGCEEAIMMGMVQFMKKHGGELDRENTYFINIESTGNGTVAYGTDEGFVRVRPYSRELVSLAKRLKDDGEFPEIDTYQVRLGTDAMVPLVRGFKAISLFAFNENNFCPNYHTLGDTPENVDIKVTERARDLALRMVKELDGTA